MILVGKQPSKALSKGKSAPKPQTGRRSWRQNILAVLRQWYRERPIAVVFAGGLATLVLGQSTELIAAALATTTARVAIGMGLFAATLASISAIFYLFKSKNPRDGGEEDDDEDLEVVRVFSQDQLTRIRTGLHAVLYGGVAPADQSLNRMYEKNPRMGVALFDPRIDDYVAFATAWPLTDSAARAIIAGEIDENALTDKDILPETLNGEANYIIIPAFGAVAPRRAFRAHTLVSEPKRTIRQNFFQDPTRRLTMIATGFSPSGERLCERRAKMEAIRHIHFSDEICPLFTRPIVYEDVA